MEQVEATVTGRLLSISVAVGDRVKVGDEIATIESMKMELPVESEYAGVVSRVCAAVDDEIEEGAVLVELAL